MAPRLSPQPVILQDVTYLVVLGDQQGQRDLETVKNYKKG